MNEDTMRPAVIAGKRIAERIARNPNRYPAAGPGPARWLAQLWPVLARMACVMLVSQATVMAQITLSRLDVTFPRAVGIDYLSTAQSLVLSVNYNGLSPADGPVFMSLGSDGVPQVFAEDAQGYIDEVKIAVVPAGNPQFPEGDVFAGNGQPGQIVRITNGGETVIDPWVTLPGETGRLRGSLYVDRTGIFGYDLIAVTTAGGVWRIGASGGDPLVRPKVATITDGGSAVHLEGVVTLPNQPATYGTNWAGKILAGAEGMGRFYYISGPNTYGWTTITADDGLTLAPEDIDVIPANQNLFLVEYGDADGPDVRAGAILTAGAAQFAGMAGDLLVTVEWGNGQQGVPGAIYRVRWNGSSYTATWLASPELGTHFEHAAFAPITITPPPPQVSLTVVPEEAFELYEQEPGTSANLLFSRTGDWAVALPVRFRLPGGTGRATFLEDYGLNPGLVPDGNGDFWFTIPSYYGNYALIVSARPDSSLEGAETVRAELQTDPNYTIDPGNPAAELVIYDTEDDHPKPYLYDLIPITPTSGEYYYNWSEGYAINNFDTVTGFFNPPPNYGIWTPHAICWDPVNGLVDLNPDPTRWSWGYGINDWGAIVGKIQPTSGGDVAAYWDATTGQAFYYPPFQTGSYGNEARAINLAGVVVGSGRNAQGVMQAIRWDPRLPLGSLSASLPSAKLSYAYAVSDSGRVVGKSRGDFGTTVFHAFRTRPEPDRIWPDDDLGTGTGSDLDTSEALGINFLDEAVGTTHFNTAEGKRSHAFLKTVYQSKHLGFRDLTPSAAVYWSRATSITSQGHVVGSYRTSAGSTQRGFVVFNDGEFRDLWAATNPAHSAGWQFNGPLAINDNGVIVGTGNFNLYFGRGFILVPVY